MLVDSTQKLSITIERLRNIICKQFLHDFDRKLELEEEIKTEIVLFD